MTRIDPIFPNPNITRTVPAQTVTPRQQEMMNFIHDQVVEVHQEVQGALDESRRVQNIHIPSSWENITNLVLSCCRWVGSLFTGRR